MFNFLKRRCAGPCLWIVASMLVFSPPLGAVENTDDVECKGVVKDATGFPLIGAGVFVKGTSQGTATDSDGAFTIMADEDAVLVFTLLGYGDKEVPVSTVMKYKEVILEESSLVMDELVVVGYGVQKKASLTGSVASVRTKDLIATKNENVTNMLAGKIPGVRVIQTSGEPGSFASSIQIRNFGTPLVIVDGVPRENMNRMDPNEIESISVLKDASASIYGVRAANGVILITTKKGSSDQKAQIEYSGYVGFQTPINTPQGLNTWQYMEIVNENNIMRGSVPYGQLQYSLEEIAKYKSGEKTGTDWWRVNSNYYAPQHNHNVSISGGSKVVNYFVNFAYMNQQGVYSTGDLNYNRYNLRANVSAQVAKGLRAEVNIGAFMDTKNSPYGSTESYWEAVWTLEPVTPAYANYDRRYMQSVKQGINPLALTDSDIVGWTRNNRKTVETTGSLIWDIPWVKGLKAKATYSYDFNFWEDKSLQRAYYLYDYNLSQNEYIPTMYGNTTVPDQNTSKSTRTTKFSESTLMQASLSYDREFGKHTVSGLLLYEESSTNMDNFGASGLIYMTSIEELFGAVSDTMTGSMNGSSYSSGTSVSGQSGFWTIANKALVGRVNYNFDNRYYAEFAFRYDGSSKFAPGHQWGFFPSASVAWRISEEPFIKNNPAMSFLSNLKLRASYGKTGDDVTATFQFVPGYDYPAGNVDWWSLLLDGQPQTMLGVRNSPNTNLTWYDVTLYDIGLDADFWHGKLGFEFDLFRRDRSGIPATRAVSIPDWIGEGLAAENLNSDRTLGFDLLVRHRNTVNQFSYGVAANVSFSRTKNVYVERISDDSQWTNWRNNPTNRWNDIWWGYDSPGQFQSYEEIFSAPITDSYGNSELKPGDYKYLDWNEDGVIDDLDKHPITYGTQNSQNLPLMTFGLTLDAQYKGFDFTVVFQGGALSNVRYSYILAQPFIQDMSGPDFFYDRWHMADPMADPEDPRTVWIPGEMPTTSQGSTAMNLNSSPSQSSIHRTDYLRCKSMELGYTLPKVITDWIGIRGIRIYCSAYNLFTITGLKYLDPEHPASGYGSIYPLIRTINFGANIKF